MTKEKVEILPACYWICPECGRDNFEYVLTAEFSPEDRELIDEVHDICFDGELDGGDYVIQPVDVTCSSRTERTRTNARQLLCMCLRYLVRLRWQVGNNDTHRHSRPALVG